MSHHSLGTIALIAALLATLISSLSFLPSIPSIISAAADASVSSESEIHSDFNGDGYEDLAIGVPEENVAAIKNAGAVNVLYGSSPSGLQTASPADQFWHQDSPGVEDAAEIGDRFGMALAAGDFNNDGRDDLAIGVPWENSATRNNPGAVNVLYGSASGLQTSSPADQFWTQDSPGVEDVGEFNDYFGTAVVAGDFNGDGYDDLAIGVPKERVGTVEVAGAVNVLYGSSSGLQATSPADQFWNQNSPGVNDAAEEGDTFGGTLAAGDFNNDGFADLAIGGAADLIPYSNLGMGTGGEEIGGAVNVLYGSDSGLQTSSPADQFWTQDSSGVEDTAEAEERFGASLASGDFNSDGFDDLAIGVPDDSVGSVENTGAINVLYGSSAGLRTTSPANQFWHQDSPGVEDAAEAGFFGGDHFGSFLAAADFNGDGIGDLAIAAVAEDIGVKAGVGAVNVLYGSSPSGLQTASPADQFWHQDSPGVEDAAENKQGEWFGFALR